MKTKKNGTLDQISRQAVFNAIEDVAYDVDAGVGSWYELMNDKVRMLPFVQPEIILCKDCTWCQTVHGKVFCSREGAMDWIEPDSYCSYGERRTDE